jgi:hypothetical protein
MDYDRAAEGDRNVMGFRIGSDGIAMVQDGAVMRRQQTGLSDYLCKRFP